jgi:hypothetical protein
VRHYNYLPKERLLITLPLSNDSIVIRPFDMIQALKKSGDDYLFVVSRPPVSAALGSTCEYRITTIARSSGLKYRLESGPDGMTVSQAGEVRWHVAKRPAGGTANVVIRLRGASGKELLHAFRIAVGS